MPATILYDCVKELLSQTGDGFQSASDAVGSTTTVVDSTLIDSSEPSQSYNGAWVRPVTGTYVGIQRRVTTGGYDDTTGTLTVGNAYAGTFGSGVMYQMSTKASFADLTTCVNWALNRAYYEDTYVAPATGMQQYTLPSWIPTREHIVTVNRRQGDTADNYTYLAVQWWGIVETSGATPGATDNVLKLVVNPIVPSNESIVVRAYRTYDALTSGSQATAMDLQWLVAGAEFKYYDLLAKRGGKADVTRYDALAKKAWTRWLAQCRAKQPIRNSDMQFSQPWVRFP